MVWRIALAGFLLLSSYLFYQLILGEQGVRRQDELAKQIQYQEMLNQRLSQRNAALRAQVEDLRQGDEAIEERIRTELQYIKEGEIFYRMVEQ